MGHCAGGDGAWAIGQGSAGNAGLQPDRNVLMAVVDWVERGKAPEAILGTKWVDDVVGGQVAFSRKHCKYPKRNKYNGGDPKKPEGWTCVA